MQVSHSLYNRIVEFLTSLPSVEVPETQRALIYQTGMDEQLLGQIAFGPPPIQFFSLLISNFIKYGRLSDGRSPIEALLESTKRYIGSNRQRECDSLIKELQNATDDELVLSEEEFKTHFFDSEVVFKSIEMSNLQFIQQKVKNGGSLIITVTIHNKSVQQFGTWLGASIVYKDWKMEFGDPNHDKTIILKPGCHSYTREFVLTNDIPNGEYKLACATWIGERAIPHNSLQISIVWTDTFYIVNVTEENQLKISLLGIDVDLGKAISPILGAASSEYGTTGKCRRYETGSIYLIETKGDGKINWLDYRVGDGFKVCDSAIGRRYEAYHYGTGSTLGFPISDEAPAWEHKREDMVVKGSLQWFEGGAIYFSPGRGAHTLPMGRIWGKFRDYEVSYEKEHRKQLTGGELGFPCTEQYKDTSKFKTSGLVQKFQYGCVIDYERGVLGVTSELYDLYNSIGLWNSELGFPTTDSRGFISNVIRSSKGKIQDFENGCLLWNDETNRSYFVYGKIYEKWVEEVLNAGFPVCSAMIIEDCLVQYFEGGVISLNNNDNNLLTFVKNA